MIGAIAGDIIGSVYEHRPIKTKDFPLFNDRCTFTDDTLLTVAVAEAILSGGGRILIRSGGLGDAIPMPGTVDLSAVGFTRTIQSLTTVGATVPLCV